ncbi:hypothetical protein QB714_002137 [Salmonella enterica]|nr:hypothetical protein [Salmonella enterica]EKS4718521.1 hypothetical protein [Salmonella enterica]EKS4722056.1 hypothetical protein [Salmonella enterica]EKS4736271.1 hypothetical protein [Salmonella enterica]EKS4773366.1 hypothetical protein [Salmonella enterica]
MSEYGNFLQRREPGTALISSFCNDCTQGLNCLAAVALQNKLKANDGIEQKLASYISALHSSGSTPLCQLLSDEESTRTEDDVLIHQKVSTWLFDDGVVIRSEYEEEQGQVSDACCLPCWIEFRVQEINTTGWSDNEKAVINNHYWWSMDELANTTDTVFPADITAILSTHQIHTDLSLLK